MYLEVQVRSRRLAAGADPSDPLPSGHVLADRHLGAGMQVAVAGDDVARVPDLDIPTASTDLR